MFSFHARMIFNLIFVAGFKDLIQKQKTPKSGVFVKLLLFLNYLIKKIL
ncbi:hypothetical protein SAMN05421841_2421 [Chryseobacterium wanjuense]|jgi:hypothetical protein|uniref:Uncharacterized protein n=1 Tax=Chryseobacterium wanjuense TaxID=356305 RepID=A0A1I0RB43_9FLAO|nr:hypothetical protein SAMN05421841_2421 [Chryseobacterium wanjuense]